MAALRIEGTRGAPPNSLMFDWTHHKDSTQRDAFFARLYRIPNPKLEEELCKRGIDPNTCKAKKDKDGNEQKFKDVARNAILDSDEEPEGTRRPPPLTYTAPTNPKPDGRGKGKKRKKEEEDVKSDSELEAKPPKPKRNTKTPKPDRSQAKPEEAGHEDLEGGDDSQGEPEKEPNEIIIKDERHKPVAPADANPLKSNTGSKKNPQGQGTTGTSQGTGRQPSKRNESKKNNSRPGSKAGGVAGGGGGDPHGGDDSDDENSDDPGGPSGRGGGAGNGGSRKRPLPPNYRFVEGPNAPSRDDNWETHYETGHPTKFSGEKWCIPNWPYTYYPESDHFLHWYNDCWRGFGNDLGPGDMNNLNWKDMKSKVQHFGRNGWQRGELLKQMHDRQLDPYALGWTGKNYTHPSIPNRFYVPKKTDQGQSKRIKDGRENIELDIGHASAINMTLSLLNYEIEGMVQRFGGWLLPVLADRIQDLRRDCHYVDGGFEAYKGGEKQDFENGWRNPRAYLDQKQKEQAEQAELEQEEEEEGAEAQDDQDHDKDEDGNHEEDEEGKDQGKDGGKDEGRGEKDKDRDDNDKDDTGKGKDNNDDDEDDDDDDDHKGDGGIVGGVPPTEGPPDGAGDGPEDEVGDTGDIDKLFEEALGGDAEDGEVSNDDWRDRALYKDPTPPLPDASTKKINNVAPKQDDQVNPGRPSPTTRILSDKLKKNVRHSNEQTSIDEHGNTVLSGTKVDDTVVREEHTGLRPNVRSPTDESGPGFVDVSPRELADDLDEERELAKERQLEAECTARKNRPWSPSPQSSKNSSKARKSGSSMSSSEGGPPDEYLSLGEVFTENTINRGVVGWPFHAQDAGPDEYPRGCFRYKDGDWIKHYLSKQQLDFVYPGNVPWIHWRDWTRPDRSPPQRIDYVVQNADQYGGPVPVPPQVPKRPTYRPKKPSPSPPNSYRQNKLAEDAERARREMLREQRKTEKINEDARRYEEKYEHIATLRDELLEAEESKDEKKIRKANAKLAKALDDHADEERAKMAEKVRKAEAKKARKAEKARRAKEKKTGKKRPRDSQEGQDGERTPKRIRTEEGEIDELFEDGLVGQDPGEDGGDDEEEEEEEEEGSNEDLDEEGDGNEEQEVEEQESSTSEEE